MFTIKLLILDVDGTLTDGGIYLSDTGSELKKFNAKDGVGIRAAISQGVEVGIISHSLNIAIIKKRAEMLGISKFYAGSASKLDVMKDWCKELSITPSNVAFIGDDINDLEILSEVGTAACPNDAHDLVKQKCNIVLQKNGGDACVRSFIDKYILNLES